jgi:hypothetical protein
MLARHVRVIRTSSGQSHGTVVTVEPIASLALLLVLLESESEFVTAVILGIKFVRAN